MSEVADAFNNPSFRAIIITELPQLFREARNEAKELNSPFIIGNIRKLKLKKLLLAYFGKDNIEFFSSTTNPGVDVKIYSHSVSIKTIRNNNAVKIIWGSDRIKMIEKMEDYTPNSNILLARINWEMKDIYQPSGLFWIPIISQLNVLRTIGFDNYVHPPREGTNSRGVPLSKQAVQALLNDANSKKIDVNWRK